MKLRSQVTPIDNNIITVCTPLSLLHFPPKPELSISLFLKLSLPTFLYLFYKLYYEIWTTIMTLLKNHITNFGENRYIRCFDRE